jgi:hypothetical protein
VQELLRIRELLTRSRRRSAWLVAALALPSSLSEADFAALWSGWGFGRRRAAGGSAMDRREGRAPIVVRNQSVMRFSIARGLPNLPVGEVRQGRRRVHVGCRCCGRRDPFVERGDVLAEDGVGRGCSCSRRSHCLPETRRVSCVVDRERLRLDESRGCRIVDVAKQRSGPATWCRRWC